MKSFKKLDNFFLISTRVGNNLFLNYHSSFRNEQYGKWKKQEACLYSSYTQAKEVTAVGYDSNRGDGDKWPDLQHILGILLIRCPDEGRGLVSRRNPNYRGSIV